MFAGVSAGGGNTTGGGNSFFGAFTGSANTTSNNNSFVGANAGFSNTTGAGNTFVGTAAGSSNTTGSGNSIVGTLAGTNNTTGSNITVVGNTANGGANNLTYAAAFGAGATVSTSNTIALGRAADEVQIPGSLRVSGTITGTVTNAQQLGGTAAANFVQTNDVRLTDARTPTAGSNNCIQNGTTQQTSSNFNISGNGTAGGTLSGNAVNAATQFTVGGNGKLRIDSSSNILVGTLRQSLFGGEPTVGGSGNTYLGISTGGGFSPPNDNLGFNTTGSNNTLIGANTSMGSPALEYATAIGAGASINSNNTIVLGRSSGSDAVIAAGSVSIGGILQVSGLGAGPGVTVCRNNSTGQISFCSSSLRYKTNVADFASGLSLINKLRPVTFDWKADGTPDVGFIAEEVNAAEPLLTIYNDKGQVEGVKYDRFSAIFVNAFKKQQSQIEAKQEQLDVLQKQVKQQQAAIEELKKLLCAGNPSADVCTQP